MAKARKPTSRRAPARTRARGSSKQRPDPLVRDLVGDPSEVPDTVVMAGFLGESSEDGRLRLYLSPQLTEFVEIAKEDLLRREPLPEGQSPLGGSLVWIRRSADVRLTRTRSRQVQAEFLQGNIVEGHLSGTVPSGFAGPRFGGIALADDSFGCYPTNWIYNCGSQTWMQWCTKTYYRDCTDAKWERVRKHVTQEITCKDGCWFTW